MRFIDAIKAEERQTKEDLYKIHFYAEGDWWHAYEWSAYLCSIFPNNLKDNEKINPTKKLLKDCNDGIIFVGLKLSSFTKYLPDTKPENIEDKHIVVDVTGIVKENFNITDYEKLLKNWKNSVTIKVNKKSNSINKSLNEINQISCINNEFKNILKEILLYDIINKTPIDNTNFINNIKKNIIDVINFV